MPTKRKIIGHNVVDKAWDSTVFTTGDLIENEDGFWTMLVKSTLGDRSTFDIVWFRCMRERLAISDMYIVGDDDDGMTHYEFWLLKQ